MKIRWEEKERERVSEGIERKMEKERATKEEKQLFWCGPKLLGLRDWQSCLPVLLFLTVHVSLSEKLVLHSPSTPAKDKTAQKMEWRKTRQQPYILFCRSNHYFFYQLSQKNKKTKTVNKSINLPKNTIKCLKVVQSDINKAYRRDPPILIEKNIMNPNPRKKKTKSRNQRRGTKRDTSLDNIISMEVLSFVLDIEPFPNQGLRPWELKPRTGIDQYPTHDSKKLKKKEPNELE